MTDKQSDSSRRRFLQGTGVAAVSVGLAGCSGGNGDTEETPTEASTPTEDKTPTEIDDSADVPTGGVFNFAVGEPPRGINILATSSAYSAVILDQIYETGATIDPVNFEMHPNVFSDWESEELDETGDNDQNNVRISFNVRTDGLTWNDGEEFTVEDVLFTYQYLQEQQPGKYISALDPIVSVEESDSSDWDCEMILNQPIGTYAYSQLGLPILPKHKWEGVDDFNTYAPFENGGPVGLGPGVVTRYEPDTSIEISFAEREGEYNLSELAWREEVPGIRSGGPFIDAMRISVYSSLSAQTQAFFEGDIDSMYGSLRTSRIEDAQNAEGLSLIDGFDTGYGHYSFNLRKTPLDDASFRQVLGFAFDDVYWVDRLQRGYAQEGDFVMPPGYTAVRPETDSDQELLTGASTQAFAFRQSSPGVVDAQGIRDFLTSGTVVTGEGGTYLGQEYPGSITGVTASQTEAKHEYSFGPVESEVLQNAETDKEIRVNGQTITEINGGPLTMYVYPADSSPQTAKMVENFIGNLQSIGIPINRQVMSFNTMVGKVYGEEDFDIFPMGWSSLSPFATSTLYGLFHSANADDHSTTDVGDENNTSTLLNNPMGYGLFEDASADDLISEARVTLDTDERNQLSREAVERIYLDFPTMITDYEVTKWPVNSADWKGFIGNIPGPGATYLSNQILQVHKNE
ncbi:ABC transporter substrate-binding protein [Halobaculum marinum]|uniref:ABC transporter substrate-binding protein n=1 Tax=Halobaculum marinum TaxID=3031996 RepID=A0ABD5X1S0_9EURY|nr:ABC transporter substrate-binding protein [Halobaculum sp. DT55]